MQRRNRLEDRRNTVRHRYMRHSLSQRQSMRPVYFAAHADGDIYCLDRCCANTPVYKRAVKRYSIRYMRRDAALHIAASLEGDTRDIDVTQTDWEREADETAEQWYWNNYDKLFPELYFNLEDYGPYQDGPKEGDFGDSWDDPARLDWDAIWDDETLVMGY